MNALMNPKRWKKVSGWKIAMGIILLGGALFLLYMNEAGSAIPMGNSLSIIP